MHYIYHTEAIVLGSKNFAEDSKYYILFTKDLGLIYASARGVRKLSSRLRFVLQDFSYIKVDLIQSKDFWKITTATKTEYSLDFFSNRKALIFLDNIFSLLRRLIISQENNQVLFSDLVSSMKILNQKKAEEYFLNLEIVLVSRILFSLGYLGDFKDRENVINQNLTIDFIKDLKVNKVSLIKKINIALKETQL